LNTPSGADERAEHLQLSGRVAVVTGASHGIGRAIAATFAAHGVRVALIARSAQQLEKTAAMIGANGGTALPLAVDVTDRDAVAGAVASAEQALGPIEMLVNNAGITDLDRFLDEDPEAWWRVVEVNLRGPMLTTHTVLPAMIARRNGLIINVASGIALGPSPLSSAYACSKAALLRLTDSIALATADHGVVAFAVSPGTVDTAMMRDVVVKLARLAPGVPEPTYHPVEKIQALCLQLASGRYSALSGCFIHVDDDVDYLLRHVDQIQRDGLYQLGLRRLASRAP